MPFKVVTIHTPLLVSEVTVCLQFIVRPKRGLWELWPAKGDAPFEGTVADGSFKIVRVIRYRNSFLPVVRGKVEPTPTGSDIRLLMTLHPLVAVFMTAFLWKVGATTPVPPAVLLFGLILVCAAFFLEANKAEHAIRECVSGDA